jgi:hypothetical protein
MPHIKVQKRCPRGHRMEMTSRRCASCGTGPARVESARSQAEATIVRKPESEASDRTRIMTREEALAQAETVRVLESPPFRLVGLSGPLANQEIEIPRGTLLIGKAPDPTTGQRHFTIDDDAFLSRNHASIECTGESLVLQDAGSTNGCYVNGARVQRSNLQHGDQVQLGASVLRVERPA